MNGFQMKNDENRIYFRNYERIPAEKELESLIKELKEAGYYIGERIDAGLEDMYKCRKDQMRFDIIFTGEEPFIYAKDKETIKELMKMFA